eukprot:457129-Amphidinium_carterae.1
MASQDVALHVRDLNLPHERVCCTDIPLNFHSFGQCPSSLELNMWQLAILKASSPTHIGFTIAPTPSLHQEWRFRADRCI